MADIATPVIARKTEEFTITQVNLARASLGINDSVSDPGKSYIIFDAVSGDNNFYLDTGGSSTYTIYKGVGGLGNQPESFTDTGGVKVLNYPAPGRYLITIEGDFNGINTTGGSPSEKDQYIAVVGGTNYPTIITLTAFEDCSKLIYVEFENVVTVGSSAFSGCTGLIEAFIPNATNIYSAAFAGCESMVRADYPLADLTITATMGTFAGCPKLVYANLPGITTVDNNMFQNCTELESVNLASLTSLALNIFGGCIKLSLLYAPLVTDIGEWAFHNCKSLKSISLPLVVSIDDNAFNGCSNLRMLELSYSSALLAAIGTTAFASVRLAIFAELSGATKTEAYDLLDALLAEGLLLFENSILFFGSGVGSEYYLTASSLLDAILAVDGTGSAIDADLLDGQHGSYYQSVSGLLSAILAIDGTGSSIDADLLDGQHGSYFAALSGATFSGYVKLGSDAPAIKIKEFTGTMTTEVASYTSIATGITHSKIIGIQALIDVTATLAVPPAADGSQVLYNDIWYSCDIVSGAIAFKPRGDGSSADVLGKPIRVTVFYKE
jgi:hypothetical protein